MNEEKQSKRHLSVSAGEESHFQSHFGPIESNKKLKLPIFQLHESLKMSLPQSVVNCCSFYSIVCNLNKVAYDTIQHLKCDIESVEDDASPLVHAATEDLESLKDREIQQVKLSVLDEEKFLLLIIESRSDDDEELISPSRTSSYSDFKEISEVFNEVVNEDSDKIQSPHLQSVLPSMSNELWKPARSWWEAKSCKNPWLEPKDHNKRWWYLKPLIQYHKFLLKCIKKLKRNNINVQASSSSVCKFLCQEINIISGHLCQLSKFTSEQWMQGLPHFSGWIRQDDERHEMTIKTIISSLPRRSVYFANNASDISLPQKEIVEYFYVAMGNIRNQIASRREMEPKKSPVEGKRSNRYSSHVHRRYYYAHQWFGDMVYSTNPYQTHLIPSSNFMYHQSFYFQPYNGVFYQNYY